MPDTAPRAAIYARYSSDLQSAASIEDHFEILIHAKDEAELRSLDDLVHLIQRKLDGAPRA